jgi:hypothetical protein
MPVPMIDGQTLERLRLIYAWSPPIIEARLESLYGIGWLAGRNWSIISDRIITQSQAWALYPMDTVRGGTILYVDLDQGYDDHELDDG